MDTRTSVSTPAHHLTMADESIAQQQKIGEGKNRKLEEKLAKADTKLTELAAREEKTDARERQFQEEQKQAWATLQEQTARKQQLLEKQAAEQDQREATLKAKSATLVTQMNALIHWDSTIAHRENNLAAREATLARTQQCLTETKKELTNHEAELAEREHAFYAYVTNMLASLQPPQATLPPRIEIPQDTRLANAQPWEDLQRDEQTLPIMRMSGSRHILLSAKPKPASISSVSSDATVKMETLKRSKNPQ